MYRRLQEAAADCDVLLLYNGANIHPEFLRYLPTFNVYSCFDDPESSDDLSRPTAAAFDAVFYGNIASRFQYESWGCKKLAWLPIFTAPSDVPPPQDQESIFSGVRDTDIVFVGEKNQWKKRRLASLVAAFPQAQCFGKGWKQGVLPPAGLSTLYLKAKLGWNIHNSTGPINRRLFTLAGHGVLPICDNKTGLGYIFDLNHEVVGFNTVSEAIELTHYYLDHNDERISLARNAYRRFWHDYHASAIWTRIAKQLQDWTRDAEKDEAAPKLPTGYIALPGIRKAAQIGDKIRRGLRKGRSVLLKARNNWQNSPNTLHEVAYLDEVSQAYIENSEMPGVNMAQDRLAKGQPLDWPDILALNWSVTTLIRHATSIVEIGSGTGPFAEFASRYPQVQIDCFEDDDFARQKAQEVRAFANVNYFGIHTGEFRDKYDLLVAVEVIEHVEDLGNFFALCCQLAPRAVFTTPNRIVVRGENHIGPPPYAPHVREFSPGEIYWMLKLYYSKVNLYYLPDVHVPWLAPMTIATHGTPIIAECLYPRQSK